MQRPFARLSIFASLIFFGAGCSPFPALISPQIAEPINTSGNLQPIAQQGGFGDIPAVPAPAVRPGSHGSVRVTATIPNVPPTETVLREVSGRPNPTVLQNIASSMSIPGNMVGPNPESHEITLSWKDADGLTWNATGSNRRLDFASQPLAAQTLTVSHLPETIQAINAATQFLQNHGVDLKRYGTAYLEPDWGAWWNTQNAQNRCMTSDTLQTIRNLAKNGNLTTSIFPTLVTRGTATCVTPEFPAIMTIRFNAAQDGQAIFTGDGAPVLAATLSYDAGADKIVSGWLTIPVDPDRSDYPGRTKDEAQDLLSRGGQGGPPHGDVTIASVTFAWFSLNDNLVPVTSYLYPALIGEGTLRTTDGATSPYRIVVPLLK